MNYFPKKRNKINPQEKWLNETEVSNLPDKEIKLMLIKIFIELGRRMKEHSENFNKRCRKHKSTKQNSQS